jgi:cell division septation protein DedD
LLAYAAGVYTGPMILPGTGHSTTSQAPSHTEKPAAAKTTAAPAHSKPTEPAKPAAAKAPEPAAQPPKPVPETAPPPTPEKAPAPAADRKSPKLDAEQLLLVGSFSQGGNADRLAQSLEKAGYGRPEVTETTARGRVWHVVRLGPFRNRADADRVAGQLKQKYDLLASVRPRPGE